MNRRFRSPNAGQTSLTLQHSTSPRSGYRPPAGHNADGYTMPERVGFKRGGSAQQKLIKGKQERAAKEKDRHQRALEWRKKNAGDQFKEILKDPTKLRYKFKKGGWIQKAVNPKHKGFCTPMTKKTCTPKRKALARTFKKMGRARKGKG